MRSGTVLESAGRLGNLPHGMRRVQKEAERRNHGFSGAIWILRRNFPRVFQRNQSWPVMVSLVSGTVSLNVSMVSLDSKIMISTAKRWNAALTQALSQMESVSRQVQPSRTS